MAKVNEIRTERLVLRRLRPEDAGDLRRMISDWDVIRMLARPPYPYTSEHAEDFIAKAFRYPWEFAITGPAFMGVVGITGHLGYWLGRPFWGKGYMTEAASALIDTYFAKDRSDIVSGVFTDNPGSRGVLSKLGFTETGVSKQMCVPRGEEVDHIDMILNRSTWLERTAKLDADARERD